MTQAKPKAPNLLAESGLPLAYPIDDEVSSVLPVPDAEGHDMAVRSVVRSLTVMQKEAIVVRSGSPVPWRLSSDEGPYLQGHDFAPAPLAVLTTGLAVDLLQSVERGLRLAGMNAAPLRTVLDTRFTIEGSLPRGTMVGGALPPEVTVHLHTHDRSATTGAVITGVMSSVTAGLVLPPLKNPFSLTVRGTQSPVGRVPALEEPPPREEVLPARFPPAGPVSGDEPIIIKTFDVGHRTPDAGVSLEEEQRRELHLRTEVTRREDGMAVADTTVHRPHGSTFRFLSDEPAGLGGEGRAPDAASYISAGIGFCFMTQLGRYAKILRRDLGDYYVVQDSRFSVGDPDRDPPVPGRAAPPRTHVYLAPDEEDSFASEAVDMSEQTCFVHAMCRTELRPKVKVLPYS